MDITIQNVRSPALEHNGRYYKVFQPRSRDELLKLHHMGCVGDTVLTDIQIEQGDFPTSFVEPTITQRSLSGLFKDMRSIELELRDPSSTLWGKIQKNNQGALSQFFDKDVKSAIAQTANEIRQEVRNATTSSDSALSRAKEELRSAISQTAGEIRQEIRSSSNASNSELSKAKDELRRETTTAITQTADSIRQEVRSSVSDSNRNANDALSKAKEELRSSLTQTASEIRQEVREAGKGAQVSVSSDGVTIGATTLTGKQLASVISTSQDGIDLIAPKIRVKSDMIVDGAITGRKMAAGSVTADHIKAGAITGDKILFDSAFFKDLTANEARLKELFAKKAFITQVQSVTLDASKITTGILDGREINGGTITGSSVSGVSITGSTISGGTLTGHTKIKLGTYGSFDTVNGGLQINVPRESGSKDGLGVQFIGSYGRGKDVPYGLFVYKDSDFTVGNYASQSDDFLLTVEGYIKAKGIGWLKTSTGSVGGGLTATIGLWNSSNVYLSFGGSANDIFYTYNNKAYSLWEVVNAHFSDRRLKENIVDCKHNALDYINQFQFKEYDWKKQEDRLRPAHTKIGLIAQEVQAVDPTLVYENGDTLNLDNLRLTAIALKAIQELNQKINLMEKKYGTII